MEQLNSTLQMLSRFQGMPQFEWMQDLTDRLQIKFNSDGSDSSVIGFDRTESTCGSQYLKYFFEAILNRQAQDITYEPFGRSPIRWTIHPYYIKQYNNRWFLFGGVEGESYIANIPLDRIREMHPSETTKYRPTEINFEEYFDDVIGVSFNPEDKPQRIRLRFSPKQFPYIRTKALHGSQRIVDADQGLVEIDVIPNYELYNRLLGFGPDVEVLSPQSVREEMQRRVCDMNKIYKA